MQVDRTAAFTRWMYFFSSLDFNMLNDSPIGPHKAVNVAFKELSNISIISFLFFHAFHGVFVCPKKKNVNVNKNIIPKAAGMNNKHIPFCFLFFLKKIF